LLNVGRKCCLFSAVFLSSVTSAAEQSDIFTLSLQELLELKVASASRFEESLSQTPVPVSVITQRMIEASGAKTLRDLLSLYVPSFTPVQDQNEYNIAFRGIYTSSQQKILILLDGQRINSYAYASANPDHAISLDKLKQIEIIRGPGSSVYGNVALTAVINLVLKTANDGKGGYTKVKLGDHGTRSIYNQWSRKDGDIDYFTWAYYFESAGENYRVTPENNYSPNPISQPITTQIDAFDDHPSTDIGLSVKSTDWAGRINFRRSHLIEPFSTAGISGEAYQYADYPKFNSVGAGAESSWLHLNGERNFHFSEKKALNISAHFDRNRVAGPLVINPSLELIGDVVWEEKSRGIVAEWRNTMDNANLAFGVQYELMEVTESSFATYASGILNSSPIEVLALGEEAVTSMFGQYKRSLDENWLVNLGARYDVKDRLTGDSIKEFSPRLAFIYNQPDFNLKLSYARSFVDPPYWNRYSALASFRGSRDLEPEILESIQITPEFMLLENQLSVKFNLYYNQHRDFVFRNNAALENQPIYTNAGEMETIGLEHEWLYRFGQNSLRLVASHYRVENVEFYEARDEEIFNIPQTQFSVIWDTQLLPHLAMQISAQHIGDRLSPINIAQNGVTVTDPFPNQGVSFFEPDFRLSNVNLVNATFRWRDESSPFQFSVSVQNLLDKKWQQGGSTVHPYPQTGRWTQISVGYHW